MSTTFGYLVYGARARTRTGTHIAKDFKSFVSTYSTTRALASAEGFEPSTYGLEVRCSIQLSYAEIYKTVLSDYCLKNGWDPTYFPYLGEPTLPARGVSYASTASSCILASNSDLIAGAFLTAYS